MLPLLVILTPPPSDWRDKKGNRDFAGTRVLYACVSQVSTVSPDVLLEWYVSVRCYEQLLRRVWIVARQHCGSVDSHVINNHMSELRSFASVLHDPNCLIVCMKHAIDQETFRYGSKQVGLPNGFEICIIRRHVLQGDGSALAMRRQPTSTQCVCSKTADRSIFSCNSDWATCRRLCTTDTRHDCFVCRLFNNCCLGRCELWSYCS